jgi:pilus assembly protein CpaF
MGILSRLKEKSAQPPVATPAAGSGATPAAVLEPLAPAPPPPPREEPSHDLKDLKKEIVFNDLKSQIHARIIHLLDLTRLAQAPENLIMEDLRRGIDIILADQKLALTLPDKDRLCREIRNELLGYGPLEPLLADPSVSDILVNRFDQVFVERRGKLERSSVRFIDNAHLQKIIEKIATGVGRRVDESSPMVDARLPDGSRVNAIIPPLALDGPSLSIRKFSRIPIKVEDLIKFGSITANIALVMAAMVKARLNILISGGTGSGKTVFLNVMSSFIPNDERIITIEDSAELQMQQEHVVRLETRPANLEGTGEVTQRDLVKNALRMRPERIILGEVRSGEALDMLQAMNTGHDGSLATIHANSPRDALGRLETMVSMAGLNIPEKAIRHQINSAINIIIQLARLSDGSRKMMNLYELVGMEGDMITVQEIFAYEMMGVTEDRKVIGRFVTRGIRPKFMKRLEALGIQLPAQVFQETPPE